MQHPHVATGLALGAAELVDVVICSGLETGPVGRAVITRHGDNADPPASRGHPDDLFAGLAALLDDHVHAQVREVGRQIAAERADHSGQRWIGVMPADGGDDHHQQIVHQGCGGRQPAVPPDPGHRQQAA